MFAATLAVVDHSPKYLCSIQRRLKSEPFDLSLFPQCPGSLDLIEHLKPAMVLVGQRIGYPHTAAPFVHALRSREALCDVPVIVSVTDGAEVPVEIPDYVSIVRVRPDFADLEAVLSTIYHFVGRRFAQ